jgi:hypothetical protein
MCCPFVRICGVMLIIPASGVVDHGFMPVCIGISNNVSV